MKNKKTKQFVNYFIAFVWLFNGLYCKVLNLVPRHKEIVGEILGLTYADVFTFIIGILEILMAVWIISGFKKRINSIFQIFIISLMNILEFILVPELLLWGKYNAIFALIFIFLIYLNEIQFPLNDKDK